MAVKVLVVDDEENIRNSILDILREESYLTSGASSLEQARSMISSEYFHVIILDVWMQDGDGIEFINTVNDVSPDSVIVMITGHGNIDLAVRAIKLGAYDFIEKPFSMDRLILSVKRAVDEALSRQRKRDDKEFEEFIGESTPILTIKNLIKRIATTKANVLITGESGTGKELVARMIHNLSGREGEFVDVNCASIPKDLIESELFGYERGAYTGAVSRKKGKFEIANEGTLFLDEIGEMDSGAQAKLLRVIETGRFTRLGGNQVVDVDVRIISATNKDLMKEISEGRFREDLYYRISVFHIHIPPLRDRGKDVILLAEYFLDKFCREYKKDRMVLSDDVKEMFLGYEWKGNVRELKNLIERVVILCDAEVVKPEHIDIPLLKEDINLHRLMEMDDFRSARREFEKIFIENKMKENNYDLKKVAEKMNIDVSSLYRKVKDYGITIPHKKN